jgi:hypothetical protein
MKKRVGKNEMRKIFKKHCLNLDFPINAQSGDTVTDWRLHYHLYDNENNDLARFARIIKEFYSDKYRTFHNGVMASLGVEKV